MNSYGWLKLFAGFYTKKTSRNNRKLKADSRIFLESLEERVVPATLDWIGASTIGSSAPGLNGAYFNLNPATGPNGASALIDSTQAAWLGNPTNNYTPAATAVLTGAIDFPNISGNGFQDNTGTTYYNIPGNNNNVEARWTGQITIPGAGVNPVPINFATTSDDGSTLYVDGILVVSNNFSQGATQRTGLASLTPGLHNIDIEYYQGGGGASMDAQWDPTGGTNFVDIPNSAFSIPTSVGNWNNSANWVDVGTASPAIPHNGDTVVFNSSVTGTGAYNSLNDIPNLTLNGIVVNNTGPTPYLITGAGVTINNTDPTLTNGISDVSKTTTILGLTSITLAANTNIDNTSAFPPSVNSAPSLLITSNIDLAGHVLSSGPSLADAVSGTPDTGLTEIGNNTANLGVISSSVPTTDAVVESGYGVLALAGNNTYDGTTSVFNGLLVAAANNSLGATTGGAKTVNPLANPLPSSPGAALGIGLGGDNAAYTNGVTIQGAGPSVLGGHLWSASPTSSVFNAPITLAGATTFNVSSGGSLSLGGSLNLGGNALTITGNDNLTLSNVITGSAASSITDADTATTTLSGNNAPFLGPININAGILAAAAANNALGNGSGAVTVASGAALGFTNSVTYSTTQPVSITGTGPGGNGAVESLSGTNSFAGLITVASGDEYLGAIGGSTSLGTAVNLATNNLFLVGSGGNLSLSGTITGPTTSSINKSGTGTDTISHNNSATFLGSTTINQGVLAVSADGALGNGSGAVTVNNNGGLGFSGGVAYNTPQPVSIVGAGTTGNGAIENLSGTNTFAGPITLNLGGDATLGADSGSNLSLSGAINLYGQTLTTTGSGNTTIGGVISGTGSSTVNNVLNGSYYTLNPSNFGNGNNGSFLIDNANAAWLGNAANGYVPAATAPLTGPMDFPNVSANSFSPYANIGGNNVEGRWVGNIAIPNNGNAGNPIDFSTVSDDGSTLYIDGVLVVSNNNFQGATRVSTVVNLTPGPHTIDVEYYQGGGGASMDAQWDPTGSTSFVDIPNSVFSILTPGTNDLVKSGSGTLTLSNNNTYIGSTTINAGTVVAANNNAFGLGTGGGVTVNTGGALALPATGGITLSAAKSISLAGTGPAGNGAIENLGGNNSVAGNITLTGNASVGSDATLTPVTVPNFSFETPNLGIGGNAAINPGPTGASWTFNAGSGIAQNNANYGPPNAPDGTQAALIQGAGANFFQSITFPSAGEYVLTFAAAGRNNAGPNPFQVSIDGTQVGTTVTPTNNVYATFTITFNIATSGAHTLTFTGLGNNGNDVTSFIDNVTLGELPAAPPTLTLSGNVALHGSNLTATGSGNTIASGVISGSGSFTTSGILGNYFATAQIPNGNTGNYLLSPASGPGQYLGTLTPTAVAVTPNIDFTDIADNGFVETGFSPGFPQISGNNVAAQWVGNITFPAGTTAVNFQAQTDDNSAIYLNGVSLPLNGQQFAGFGASTGSIPVTAGTPISFEVDYEQGGGGADAEINWDLTGGNNFVSIPASAFSIVQNLNSVTKTGLGTLTLSNTNTYIGVTTINAGTVVATVDGALGTAAGGTTVNAGGALVFGNGITYATAEPVTIAGNGPTNNGAIENLSGTSSFAGPIVLSATADIGSVAGTFTLSGGISGNGNLILPGPATTTITGGINLTTGDLDVTSVGATNLNGPIALGSGNVNLSGPGTITIGGSITFTGTGNLSISSAGTTNINGVVTLGSPVSGNVLFSGSGPATLSNTVNLGGGNVVDTSSGQEIISGNITGSVGSAPGLNGMYYNNLVVPGNGMGAELSTLTTLTPAASEVLTGSLNGGMIDLPNIDQNNNSFTQALTLGAAAGPSIGTSNIAAVWTGNITIPTTVNGNSGPGAVPITFLTGSDDGSNVYIDGTQIVFNDQPQGVTYRAGIDNLVPGSTHTIAITFYQGGGGASMFLNWDLTGGTPANYVSGNAAGVLIPASVFSIPGDSVTMSGSGSLTLSGNNSYIGQTSVLSGTVVVGANNALGTTAGSTTVAAGARITFPTVGGLNYTTAEPVTILGTGIGGKGAIENVSGANTFGGAITLGANATIGSDAGTLTLGGSTISPSGNNLTFTGAGNLAISDTIVDPTTTNQLIQAGTGTTTLSGNNTYAGLTSVNMGTLIVAANNALGAIGTGTTVASGATLGIQGGITYSALEPITLNGIGVGGVGAFANVSGNNSFAGPIGLATDSTIGSETVGNTLTLIGNISNANAATTSNLAFTGAGSINVTGSIQTQPPIPNELLGQYYNAPNGVNFNQGSAPLNPASANWLGNDTPTVTEVLTGSNTAAPNSAPAGAMINLTDISQAANDSFADALTAGGAAGPSVGTNNIAALWTGLITIPNTAASTITFLAGSDDGSVIFIDGNLVVNNAFDQGVTYRAGQVSLVPGSTHSITIGYYQGGGGASMFANWDLTGATAANYQSGNAAGVPIPISAFSFGVPGIANVVKNGSGTVTLGATNTYSGTTTINNGILQVSSDANLGATANSSVTINAGTLEALGTFSSTHNYVVGNAASTILVDPTQTLTIPTVITGTGNLNKTGSGTLILTAGNTYSGGTTVTAGTINAAGPTPLGTGTVTMAGGSLSLLGGQNLPVAVTGFNQDVVWTGSEANSQVGTTAALDSGGNHVFYAAGVPFTPGGGLPSSQIIVSQSNAATEFNLQPYTGTNVLLATDTNNHTLALATPGQFQTLNILDAAANGASTFNVTLNFATGSPTVLTGQSAPDWFSGGASAISGLGAITRATSGLSFSGLPNNPSLYELDLTLSAGDQARVLNSITFTQTSAGTNLGIFAVSGQAVQPVQSYVNNVVVSADSTITVQNGPATMGTLSIGSNMLTTTGGVGNGLTFGSTTLTGNPTFAPAASTTLTLGALNDGSTARTITINGAGTVTLLASAMSAVTGTAVNIVNGTLNLNAAGALGTFANTTVASVGILNLGANQTLGALNGAGTVNLNGNTLTVGSTNNLSSTFTGALGDGTVAGGGLVKAGTGTFTLGTGATPTYSGSTAVNGGTLLIDVNLPNSTSVAVANGGTLGGSGAGAISHAVTVASGGTVSPGDVPGATASISTGGVSLATGSTYNVELGGTAVGSFDQLVVSSGGSVNLNGGSGVGATLNLSLANNFVPALNQTFAIINNQGTNAVVGNFNGLAPGATVTVNNRYVFTISYTGGANNNSVVLTVSQVPGAAKTFTVVASPSSITAGGTVNYTVTALDANNLVAIGYGGTVTFTSSDGKAVLSPNPYMFTTGPGGDNGIHTFTATLKTAGNQTITATDTLITGTSNAITVTPGSFTQFVVDLPAGTTVVAGNAFIFTVQAADSFGNAVSSYSGPGSVSITEAPTDSQGTIPASVSIDSSGLGFGLNTLRTVGSYTITASAGTITGTSKPISVTSAAASHFTIAAPNTAVTGSAISITVTALDPFNNVATGYLGTVHFTSTDSALTPISNYTFVNGNAGVQSFNATFNTPALVQTITATDTGNATINGTSNAIKVQGLAVSNFTPTDTGFVATLDTGFNATPLHLYAQTTAALTNPSVTVVLGASTKIAGTLLVNTATNTITFVKTNTTSTTTPSALAAGTYTVTFLSSATNGFVETTGGLLAGDTNGVVPGTNFTTTFTVTAATAAEPTLFVADFARGPNTSSTIKVPNNTGTGIPLTLTNATAVTSVTFTMSYDPTLLNITGVAGANLTLVSNSGGVASFSYTNATPQNGTVILGQILADVPNSAASNYKAKELLHIGNPVINGTSSTVRSGDGIHVNAYLGDVSGNGVVNGADVNSISFIPGGGFTGFSAFPLADPVILADVNADGLVNSTDLGQYNRFVANLTAPTIPVPPTGLTFTATGPDPTLSIPATLPAVAGGTVTVPVNLDDPRPVGSTGMTEATLALVYDPKVLSVSAADINLGSIPLSGTGWKLVSVVDATTGQIGIDLYSTTPIADATAGSLVTITFHVNKGATPGSTAVELLASGSANPDGQGVLRTEVDDKQGAFVLTPAPINGPGGITGSVVVQQTAKSAVAGAQPSASLSAVAPAESLALVASTVPAAVSAVTKPGAVVVAVAPVVKSQSAGGLVTQSASGQTTTSGVQNAVSNVAQKPIDALLNDILNEFLAQTKHLLLKTI